MYSVFSSIHSTFWWCNYRRGKLINNDLDQLSLFCVVKYICNYIISGINLSHIDKAKKACILCTQIMVNFSVKYIFTVPTIIFLNKRCFTIFQHIPQFKVDTPLLLWCRWLRVIYSQWINMWCVVALYIYPSLMDLVG